MVRRVRGSDGAPFWGCSTFPSCRGTRELVAVASGGLQPTNRFVTTVSRDNRPGLHLDRLVIVCGAVGLLISLGFIMVGLSSGPNSYGILGAILLALVALVVLPSPFVSRDFARGNALKVAFLCVFLAVFFVAHDPLSRWLGHYWADLFKQSIPTHPLAPPSIAH
jgi:hypothetical protein